MRTVEQPPLPSLRILHWCWEYPPAGSGIGQYIQSISAGLRALGCYSVIVTSRAEGLPETESLQNGKIYRIYNRADIGRKWLTAKVLEIAAFEKIDLIEAPEHFGEAGLLLRHKNRPPVMINCRYNDVLRQARYSQVYFSWQKWMIELARLRQWKVHQRERYSIEHADLLAAPSRIMLDGLKNQGVRITEKSTVLPKPLIPLDEWKNAEADRPTVLMLGRIDVGKGIQFLPDIIRQVRTSVPDVRFEVAGSGSYARGLGNCRDWLERHLGSEIDYVTFTGQLNRNQVDDAYRRAWVVIVPSKWDTSPTTVLEAMQRSKPVVASPFGGMPEYLEATGCRIEDPHRPSFASAISEFLRDKSARISAGESGRRKAIAEFLPETCARKYIDFISSHL
jgi:glycosyltransferase involved in cell wall biosynthesis